MSYESYRARIRSYGGNAQESMSNITKHSQRQMILNSPTRKTVRVNNDSFAQHCIVSDMDTYFKRRFLFMPDFAIQNGDYIYHDNCTYLVTDSKISEEIPEGIAHLCNAIFPLQTRSTTEPVLDFNGNYQYDEFDEIITREVPSQVDLPCVVENKYRVSDKSEQMWVADNDITVTIPYRDEVKLGIKFEMYGDKYKVINIDRTKVLNGIGILTLRGEKED